MAASGNSPLRQATSPHSRIPSPLRASSWVLRAGRDSSHPVQSPPITSFYGKGGQNREEVIQQIMTEEGLEHMSSDSHNHVISTMSLAREAQDMKWSNVGAPDFTLLPRLSSQHLPCMEFDLRWLMGER